MDDQLLQLALNIQLQLLNLAHFRGVQSGILPVEMQPQHARLLLPRRAMGWLVQSQEGLE